MKTHMRPLTADSSVWGVWWLVQVCGVTWCQRYVMDETRAVTRGTAGESSHMSLIYDSYMRPWLI